MRIAAHNGAPVWGGAEIALCRLLSGLSSRGHRTLLYYNRELVGRRAREEFGLETRHLHLGGDVAIHHAFRFARALRSFHPDALVVGTFRKLLLAALGGRMAGVPRIVARIGLSTDTPRNLKYRIVFRWWVDGIVVNDDELRAAYRAALPRCPADRLVTVYKGTPPPGRRKPEGAVRAELGLGPDVPVMGALARLDPQKRLDRLISLTARLPESVHCLIAGEGRRRAELENHARSEGVADRVHFLGFRDDVGDVLSALDVLVVTSDRESLANAMLEALAAGVPVVSTPVSGAAEALEPLDPGEREALLAEMHGTGGSGNARDDARGSESTGPGGARGTEGAEAALPRPGVLAEPDVESLARAAEPILFDSERRGRMSAAARVRARVRFSRERMLDEWERALQTV